MGGRGGPTRYLNKIEELPKSETRTPSAATKTKGMRFECAKGDRELVMRKRVDNESQKFEEKKNNEWN